MFSPEELEAAKLSYDSSQARQPQKQSQQKKKVGGLKGLIAGALPLIGGTVGTVLGGVAGTIAAPVAGTAAGGMAGGAGGSALGKYAAQKLLGEDTNYGDIAKEGLLGAIPGGVGLAAKGLRGAVTAAKGARSVDTATDVARATPQTTEQVMLAKKPDIKQKLGERLTESGSGLKIDKNKGVNAAEDLQGRSQFMAQYTGTPRQQLGSMQGDMQRLGTETDDLLAKNAGALNGTQVTTKVQSALDDPLVYPDLDLTPPGTQRLLKAYEQKFAAAKDPTEVNERVKEVNKLALRAQKKLENPNATALTSSETAALAFKRAGDEALGQVEGLQPLKQAQAQLFDAAPSVAKASEQGIGLPFVSGVNVRAPVQALKGIQSRAGAKLQGGTQPPGAQPPATGGVPTGYSPYIKSGVQQATSRALVSPFLAAPEPEAPAEDNTEQVQLPKVDPASTDMSQQPTSPFSDPQAVQTAYMNALAAGDAEAAKLIMAGYETFGQAQGAAQKPLSAEASKVISNANSGLTSLDQLNSMIQNGGVPKGTLIPGRDLFGGAGAAALGTSSYDTAARNIADVITRLRTGAALTEQEEAFYKSQLPQAMDPPETVQQKMNMFRDLFNSVASRSGTAGTDAQAAMGV